MRRGPGVAQAVSRFEQSIDKDREFARAHAGLALALELLPYFSPVSAQSIRARAVAAANRALALDSTQAEAHTALALSHAHAYEWAAALKEHQRAISIDPTDAAARTQYGRHLHYMGREMEARAEFQRARAADPYDAVASGWLGHLLSLTNRHAEAVAELDRALEIDSDSAPPVLFMAVQANMVAGDTARAKAIAERLWARVPQWRGPTAFLLAELGDRARAAAVARQIEATPLPGYGSASTASIIYVALGDTARALDLLERATDAGEIWPTSYSLSERELDPLRRSARFAALVRRVGLDERIFTSPTGGRPQ
jgi:Tfp pilus assembly protein PilF